MSKFLSLIFILSTYSNISLAKVCEDSVKDKMRPFVQLNLADSDGPLLYSVDYIAYGQEKVEIDNTEYESEQYLVMAQYGGFKSIAYTVIVIPAKDCQFTDVTLEGRRLLELY